jgi:diguanylate cyclase (GGDEF)-like protein
MFAPFSELFRIDPLTGCNNYLGFLETLVHNSLSDLSTEVRPRGYGRKEKINASIFSAVLFADMIDIDVLNKTKGHAYADSALRWMGILLQEESGSEVYRLGGDEFAVLLKLETRDAHLGLVDRILKRMELQARQFGFPDAAADTVLIFFDQISTSLDLILLLMEEAMRIIKSSRKCHFMSFESADFQIQTQIPARWKSSHEQEISLSVHWLSFNGIQQVLAMGRILNETKQEAYTDAISGLPNMKAAQINMEKAIQNSTSSHTPFSIMMIDGDNIRAYNRINYAAGDEMIRDLCAVLKESVRPSDFVARWRTGDEFMIILPDTPSKGAGILGERIRLAVREASRAWKFPVTVSIGIASYPTHAENIDTLVDRAEYANKRAKDQGKDQVVLAD